jgi:hypothetical protein
MLSDLDVFEEPYAAPEYERVQINIKVVDQIMFHQFFTQYASALLQGSTLHAPRLMKNKVAPPALSSIFGASITLSRLINVASISFLMIASSS